jgi:hypothetical protein
MIVLADRINSIPCDEGSFIFKQNYISFVLVIFFEMKKLGYFILKSWFFVEDAFDVMLGGKSLTDVVLSLTFGYELEYVVVRMDNFRQFILDEVMLVLAMLPVLEQRKGTVGCDVFEQPLHSAQNN